MSHTTSAADQAFREDFEAGRVLPAQFDHRCHVRLAYIYLTEGTADAASQRMREALQSFLARHGIPAAKYHETLTRSWTLAVRYFMDRTPTSDSAAAFIAAQPLLLDTQIMLTHYSAEVLFSEQARGQFIEPNLTNIPRT